MSSPVSQPVDRTSSQALGVTPSPPDGSLPSSVDRNNGLLVGATVGAQMSTPATDFSNALDAALRPGWVAAVRILGDRELARDAVQEAATRALAARDRYDTTKPFYPWFYRILRNHCMDLIKSRQRMHPGHVRDVAEQDQGFFIQPTPSAESVLAASQEQAHVSAAITELGDEHREIIELRHFQDLSYEDMADVLGVAKGTVMSRLYRARKALRALLLQTPDFADHGGEA